MESIQITVRKTKAVFVLNKEKESHAEELSRVTAFAGGA
jgi:hypothetical protein